jgi:hypothetical protein
MFEVSAFIEAVGLADVLLREIKFVLPRFGKARPIEADPLLIAVGSWR